MLTVFGAQENVCRPTYPSWAPNRDPGYFDLSYAVCGAVVASRWSTGKQVIDDLGRYRGHWHLMVADLSPGGLVTLIARFQVDSFEPRHVAGWDADWLGLMTFAKTFTSGITGQSATLFMSAGSQEGSRSYVATERISGRTDDGREGTVTVQHGGLESDPGTWFGHIVPGTGTGAFTGWSGSARIVHDDEGAYFEITLA